MVRREAWHVSRCLPTCQALAMNVELSKEQINYLAALLRDSAHRKQKRARSVHPNDRADMEAAAMRDYELRKLLIAAKLRG